MVGGEHPPVPDPELLEDDGPDFNPQRRLVEQTPVLNREVAALIGEHDLAVDADDGYKYDAESMLKAFLYVEVLDEYRSYHALESHLAASPRVAERLGFTDGVPDWDTFRDWYQERLPEEQLEALPDVAEIYFQPRVRRELGERIPEAASLGLDIDPDNGIQKAKVTAGAKREAVRHLREHSYDLLDFDRRYNHTYQRKELLDLQAKVSREGEYVQGEIDDRREELELELEDGADPDELDPVMAPRTHFDAIKNKSTYKWEHEFRQVYDRQILAAKGAGMLDRPVHVYIDETVRPFYKNNGRPPGVCGGEEKNGTYYGYHHATICAQVGGRSILLATYQMTPDASPTDAVKYLIRRAREHVSIKEVHMDSAYRKATMLKWLNEQGLPWTIQYPKHGKDIKLKLARMSGTHDHDTHAIEGSKKQATVDATLMAEPDYDNVDGDFEFDRHEESGQMGLEDYGGGVDLESMDLDEIDSRQWQARRAYLTNKVPEDVSDEEKERIRDYEERAERFGTFSDAKSAIGRYKKRWRIETKYRVIKNHFLAMTTSREFEVRAFFWLFACMMYNAWVLLDVFIRADHPDEDLGDRPIMPAKSFGKKFFQVEPG